MMNKLHSILKGNPATAITVGLFNSSLCCCFSLNSFESNLFLVHFDKYWTGISTFSNSMCLFGSAVFIEIWSHLFIGGRPTVSRYPFLLVLFSTFQVSPWNKISFSFGFLEPSNSHPPSLSFCFPFFLSFFPSIGNSILLKAF